MFTEDVVVGYHNALSFFYHLLEQGSEDFSDIFL